ncbi:unnamed protein product [marine sediment metagenome]|uniref:Uncharacterized protein n=1 Tax=marine sediment metagenome TaxID=412755 RepID=X1HFS6_9ZZZZ
MIPTGFAIVAVVITAAVFYAIGGLVEHYKSQWEIDVLTRIIEGRCEEDITYGSQTSRSN